MSESQTSTPETVTATAETEEGALIEQLMSHELDTREGAAPSLWEERFEAQINTFFDEAIARVPGFVDRHLRSFRRVMGRSLSPRTGLGDILVGARNLMAGVARAAGGPDLSTTTYTHDQLTEAFAREVVSSEELESLLSRLFAEFEDAQWSRIGEDATPAESRSRLVSMMEGEIAHDPLLAQAIRSGIKLGLPATLGYVLFGKVSIGGVGAEAASRLYEQRLSFYNRLLLRIGRFELPGWLGAVGWAGGVIGSLAIGGVMEYAVNSVRDIKGAYIRQLNTARYILLYGEDPEEPTGQGLLHIVRGLERRFEHVQSISALLPEGLAAGSEEE